MGTMERKIRHDQAAGKERRMGGSSQCLQSVQSSSFFCKRQTSRTMSPSPSSLQTGSKCSIVAPGNESLYVQPKFSLGVNGKRRPHKNDRTHTKDKDNPAETQPQAGHHSPIESSGGCIFFAPLGDLASDIFHSHAMESK